ncbi:MAG: DEAD/DEAH box helicase [Chloroflexi bacterium]|nr:DEAD/DEAH box helicase [Chloroflexota bacterium]
MDALSDFHPAIQAWFRQRFSVPTDAQTEGWPHIRAGSDTLIAAPTGSGKTLAAFLAGIDALIRQTEREPLADAVSILYVSPLRALGNDIHRNLETPLAEIRRVAASLGEELPEIRVAVRSGDTPASKRQALTRKPPHILITTPESLYLLLSAERSRGTLRHVRTVIVDEIHALVGNRRGTHLALSLARLDHVAATRPVRIGLSATQKPIAGMAQFLIGSDRCRDDGSPDCALVDLGHQRDLDIAIEVPPSELDAIISHPQWDEIYERLAALIGTHRTTLIFVNTRALAERVGHRLAERMGDDKVAGHHGSLSKERRLRLEARLRSGDLAALVTTSALELGIDIGGIDLVCQIGSPRRIATFLQRVGRSGHALGLQPKGRLLPTTRDELVECAALVRAVRAGRLDRTVPLEAPLDVLAQQIVAECASEPWPVADLHALCRRATPYRTLERAAFEEIVTMLADGVGEGGGRTKPLLHYDRINGMVRGRRHARITALTNGGVIPELGDYRVLADPDDTFVGTLNEDFAIESQAGDIFLLGTTSWRIRKVETGIVRVQDAQGAPPTVPFWLGEGPGRSVELSAEVGRLRREIVAGLPEPEALRKRLAAEARLDGSGAAQLIDYVRVTHEALGVMPSDEDVVFERFFDESGGMQLVVHAPFGSRINRAWGLALRKQFCVRFDFELQAAANDDAILLSLGPAQSFPLEEAFEYVRPANAPLAVEQSLIYIPLFGTRWRWNATRALAVQRQRGGKKVPPPIQRMRSDDLLAAVFPQSVGCQENVSGPIAMPDHPLIRQTVRDCMEEAMDVPGLVEILERIESGAVALHARDSTTPSPMAHEIIGAKPYAFLDDAPLEERRARAVMLRRALPEHARDLGALDSSAIERVRQEARPAPRDAEEAHEVLSTLVAATQGLVEPWRHWAEELRDAGRAALARTDRGSVWLAAENVNLIALLFPNAPIEPRRNLPEGVAAEADDRDAARLQLLRGHMEIAGPVTAAALAAQTALDPSDVQRGLQQLEAGGQILRGAFTRQAAAGSEFCDRALLARIHRHTLDRLRREIEPVTAQDFMRFLLRWQHCTSDTRVHGKAGLREVLRQLQGFELPASAWEREVLPLRIGNYQPAWLDELCLAGEIVWARLTPKRGTATGSAIAPSRATPVTIARRADFATLLAAVRLHDDPPAPASGAAKELLTLLRERGALFTEDLVAATRRLPSDVEGGLRELVARGLATADGFQGLRQLIGGSRATPRRPGGRFLRSGPAGRWALIAQQPKVEGEAVEDLAERTAQILLARYGVVCRDLLTRESIGLPWRQIVRALRRLEARGDVRGGRFISGLVGEQYALPEAVDALRAVRRRARSEEQVRLSAVDPLNLVGVILPGEKVAARAGARVTLVDGAFSPQAPATPAARHESLV